MNSERLILVAALANLLFAGILPAWRAWERQAQVAELTRRVERLEESAALSQSSAPIED